MYWNSQRVIDLLLQRGASIHNLRIAADLGRVDVMETFFDPDGNLRPNAGPINWPWGDLTVIERSNFDPAGKRMLVETFASFSNDRQGIVDNAFVYACMYGHVEAAKFLLSKGASINAIPGGFDYSGTACTTQPSTAVARWPSSSSSTAPMCRSLIRRLAACRQVGPSTAAIPRSKHFLIERPEPTAAAWYPLRSHRKTRPRFCGRIFYRVGRRNNRRSV